MAAPSDKVQHDYNDHSQVEPESSVQRGEEGFTEANFPVKLHYILSELRSDGLEHVISWQPHGRCFIIHRKKEFIETVLPLWFRQSKFSSFQRQLNLYGFKRISSGRDKGCYYHEYFLRSKRFLAHRIQRVKIKGTGARKPGSPETEPNFYILPFLPEDQPNRSDQRSVTGSVLPSTGRVTIPSVSNGALLLQQALGSSLYPSLQQRSSASTAAAACAAQAMTTPRFTNSSLLLEDLLEKSRSNLLQLGLGTHLYTHPGLDSHSGGALLSAPLTLGGAQINDPIYDILLRRQQEAQALAALQELGDRSSG